MLKLADYDRPPDSRRVMVLKEAARRAAWDATHGPPHLRAGRFRPEDDPELMERTRKWFAEEKAD